MNDFEKLKKMEKIQKLLAEDQSLLPDILDIAKCNLKEFERKSYIKTSNTAFNAITQLCCFIDHKKMRQCGLGPYLDTLSILAKHGKESLSMSTRRFIQNAREMYEMETNNKIDLHDFMKQTRANDYHYLVKILTGKEDK